MRSSVDRGDVDRDPAISRAVTTEIAASVFRGSQWLPNILFSQKFSRKDDPG